jgi:hypothetical protein
MQTDAYHLSIKKPDRLLPHRESNLSGKESPFGNTKRLG